MADQADVENSLVNIVTGVLYPSGVSGPSAVSPINGAVTSISRGWPVPATLDAILTAKGVLVRVYPEPGMTRNTTRYAPAWKQRPAVVPTLTASVTGPIVTFGGIGSAAHVAAILWGGQAVNYRLSDGDGPGQVAAYFASVIIGSGLNGNAVSIPTNLDVTVRIEVDQPSSLEVRRQDQGFRVSVWASSFAPRDQTAATIDAALATLPATDEFGNAIATGTMFLALADGSNGWLRYRSTTNLDNAEKAGLYRRDLCYLVEYPTEIVQNAPPFVVGEIPLSAGVDVIVQRGSIVPPSTETITV